MVITRLGLKNWRNFRQVDIKLEPRVFIAGPNASGKSNLLDVFAFLRDLAKPSGGLQNAVADRGGVSKLRCLAARKEPDIEIEVAVQDGLTLWSYSLGIKQESRGYRRPRLVFERVRRNRVVLVERPDAEDTKDPERLTQTSLEQISANAKFRDLSRFFETITYLHLVPQLLRHPEAFSGPGVAGDPFGRSFLERVARTPEKVRRSRLKKIEGALKLAVPQLKQLTDVKDEAGIPHLEAIYQHWRPHGARQRENQFSDGTLRLIGLFWSLLEGASLLLLEEPELSLNAGIVRRLPGLMHRTQRQRRRQIIISTHSWELLRDDGITDDEVVLLTPGEEGTQVSMATDDDEIRGLMEGGMSAADAALPHTIPRRVRQMQLFN